MATVVFRMACEKDLFSKLCVGKCNKMTTDMDTGRKEVEYEYALKMTGFSRHNLYIFLLCSSVIVGAIFEISSSSILILPSSSELNIDSGQQALFAKLLLLGIFATAHTWGYLGDTQGRKKVLVIKMTTGFIVGVLATFSPHWIVYLVLKIISSASVGCGYLISQTLLSECTSAPRKHVLLILSNTVALVALGLIHVIPIPILPLEFSLHIPILNIQFNSWRLLNLMFAVPSAISAILVTRLYESPKYLLSEGRTIEALEILRGIYVRNTGDSGENLKVQVETLFLNEACMATKPSNLFRSILARTLPIFKSPNKKNLHLFQWIYTFFVFSLSIFLLWLPSIVDVIMTADPANSLTFCGMLKASKYSTAIEKHNDNCPVSSSTMAIIFGVCMILAVWNVITSSLAIFVDRKKIFIAIQFIAGFALLCVIASRSQMMIAGFFLIFLASLLNFGVINSYIFEIYPTFIRASAACLLMVMALGQGQFIFGLVRRLLDNHCEYVFYLFGVFTCIGGLLGLLLPSQAETCEKKKHDELRLMEI